MGHGQAAREERFNMLTHAAGVAASAVGAAVLIWLAVTSGDGWRIAGAIVFSLSLILLYTASTLYHTFQGETTKARLRVFDHCAIFVLIAGTYTPFTLVALRDSGGWALFAAVWGLTAAGIILKLFFTGRFRVASVVIYIVMGWLVVTAAGPVSQALTGATLLWLVIGGLAYTGGTFFYLNRRIPYHHGIWHLFVLGGSVCHFIAVARQVGPVGA